MKCQYCAKEMDKGIKMHEKYCKHNPMNTNAVQHIPVKGDTKHTDRPQLFNTEDLMKSTIKTEEPKKTSWISSIFTKKQKPIPKEATIQEILIKLPKWSIKKGKPWFKPKNEKATWIQIVAFSRTRPPVACWAEYDGVSISINDMFFPAPHDIRGDIFPYDMDKGIPLLENSDPFNDMSYWNKLVERVKNMYFTLGLVTGAGDFTKNIGLILMLLCGVGLLVLVGLALTYQNINAITATNNNVINLTIAVKNYTAMHP